MQICKERLPLAESRILWFHRLLDFNDHLRLCPDLFATGQISASLSVLVVCNTATLTGAFLDKHSVAFIRQGFYTRRNHTHAVLIVLDLFWNADDHELSSG